MRYAIGDIHGCVGTLANLVEQVLAIQENDALYLVGDFIDKGPDSKGVIDYLHKLSQRGISIFPVRGNREQELLELIQGNGDFWDWFARGGKETMKSFHLKGNKASALKQIPNSYLSFLMSTPHYIELEDYIIVHAGLKEKDSVYMDRKSMLYARDLHKKNYSLHKKIIHGHQPFTTEQIKKNITDPDCRIYSIDSGCVNKKRGMGYLTALNMDTTALYFQKNVDF